MKAAQVLLLLIAFIAASHLRRDIAIRKGRLASMQQDRQIADRTQMPAVNSSTGYADERTGFKAMKFQDRFITKKKSSKNY